MQPGKEYSGKKRTTANIYGCQRKIKLADHWIFLPVKELSYIYDPPGSE